MFGVINIITRHSAETVGGELSVSTGDNGIRDRRARIGVGDETASFRLSIGEQRDSGYLNAYDDRRLGQVNLRADFKPTMFDEVMVAMGMSYLDAGEGFSPTDDGNPFHTIRTRDAYWMAEWRRQLNDTDEIKVLQPTTWKTVNGTMRHPRRLTRMTNLLMRPGNWRCGTTTVSGAVRSLELQGTFSLTAGLRALLGLGHQGEQARSRGLYDWQNGYRSESPGHSVRWSGGPLPSGWSMRGCLPVSTVRRAPTIHPA